tara:strand:+ start:154 stop:357 length:204 start_codon:yes stop_codon:yes gene_type:complete
MDIFFTYLKEEKHKLLINNLTQEIERLDYLISLNSDSEIKCNKFLNDYSKSLFTPLNEEDSDGVILN